LGSLNKVNMVIAIPVMDRLEVCLRELKVGFKVEFKCY